MKKLFILTFIIFVYSATSFSQWEFLNGIEPHWVKSMASNNLYIFAGNYILVGDNQKTEGLGVYTSTNNGNTWNITSLTKPTINLHFNNTRLYACTDHEGTYYTDNNGLNWTLLNIPSDLQVLASNSIFLFGGGQTGFYSTTNNGLNWTTISSGATTVIFVKDNYVFANSIYALKISTNNGLNWSQTSLDNKSIYSLATNGTDIFAGTYNGLYKSTNNGANWSIISPTNNYWVVSVLAFENNIIISDYNGNGIYKSTNQGLNWVQRNEGLGTSSIHMGILFKANDYIFASGSTGLWRRSLQNIINIKTISQNIPNNYSLSQNYPNPFNPITTIRFDISKASNIILKIFDVTGKEISTLINEKLDAGTYELTFNGSNLSNGIYYYRLISGGFIETKKMVLIK